jgi:uncharacterized protein (DUF849 family)
MYISAIVMVRRAYNRMILPDHWKLSDLELIEAVLNRVKLKLPRLLHGENVTAWELVKVAVSRGYDTRIGFEDVLTLPDGTLADGNASLIAAACQIAAAA